MAGEAPGNSNLIRLLFFNRIFCLKPLVPTSLKCVNLIISLVRKLPCHTGTGSLVFSGTIEDKDFVLWVLVCPGFELSRILSVRTFNS